MLASKTDTKSVGRLKKRSDFLRVQKSGRKWVAKGMVVEVAENENLGIRYGLTVSKKVSKLAVTRNRIRRRLKAVASDVLGVYGTYDLDVVLIGRVSTEKRGFEDLKQDLRWCLSKMGIEKASDENCPD